jgi:hypothetical protein
VIDDLVALTRLAQDCRSNSARVQAYAAADDGPGALQNVPRSLDPRRNHQRRDSESTVLISTANHDLLESPLATPGSVQGLSNIG